MLGGLLTPFSGGDQISEMNMTRQLVEPPQKPAKNHSPIRRWSFEFQCWCLLLLSRYNIGVKSQESTIDRRSNRWSKHYRNLLGDRRWRCMKRAVMFLQFGRRMRIPCSCRMILLDYCQSIPRKKTGGAGWQWSWLFISKITYLWSPFVTSHLDATHVKPESASPWFIITKIKFQFDVLIKNAVLTTKIDILSNLIWDEIWI